MYPKVTLVFKYEDKHERGEEHFTGYLTDRNHAMYILGDELIFKRIVATEQPDVYNLDSGYFPLGTIEHDGQVEELIKALKQKSAYDFLTDVLLNVQHEIDFGELIIPRFIQ